MKTKTNTRVATWLVLSFASLGAASAGVLVSYPFNNSSDGSSGFAYSSLDATVLASSAVSKGAGLGQYLVGTDFGYPGELLKTGPATSVADASAATALANNWYFEFTLTPSSSMDIGSIDADWSRGGTTGTRGWFIRSSVDNYASDLFAVESPGGTATGFQHVNVELTGFTDLSTATSFRFYTYTPSTGRYMDFRDVQFNELAGGGTSAVPEPSGFLATSLLLGAAGLIRRRQARAA